MMPACHEDPAVSCQWDDDVNDCPCMDPTELEPAPTVETVPTGEYL